MQLTTNNGVSLPTILGLVFIILKLCNVIDWSWIWVLAPFWLGITFFIGFIITILILKVWVEK